MTEIPTHVDSLPDSPGHLHQRRRWLLGAVAGVAALGGAGLAWRNHVPPTQPNRVEPGFWQLEFATPQGEKLAMERLRGKPLLLNFWATWCPPCIEELPLISTFYRQNSLKGWQVLGLAVDQVEPVKHFLIQTPVAFPVAIAGMSGIELSRSLGNLAGALPFTVVLGPDARVAHRKMGRITPDDLRLWAEFT
jgi:thiol-disulfide isomerase/thioredoxin